MRSKSWIPILILLTIAISLPRIGNARMIALMPSPQTGNLVCGGGTEAQYAELAAGWAVDYLLSSFGNQDHAVGIFYGSDGLASRVNNWGAEAFVALHTNGSTSDGSQCLGTATGTMTVYNRDRKTSDEEIARCVQTNLVEWLGYPDRGYGVWEYQGVPANIYYMVGITAPNCLEEALFHDHQQEAEFLRSEIGPRRIGAGVAFGVQMSFSPYIDWQYVSSSPIIRGQSIYFNYSIVNGTLNAINILLGAQIKKSSDPNAVWMDDPDRDVIVTVAPGGAWYQRSFVIPSDADIGLYDVRWVILDPDNSAKWFDSKEQSEAVKVIAFVANRPGDLNGDGYVNAQDFSILMGYWGSTSKPKADINQDGRVDVKDFAIMLSNYDH